MKLMKKLMAMLVVLAAIFILQTVSVAAPVSAPEEPAASTSSASGSDVIKDFYAQLVDTMKQGDQLGFAGRYKKLEPAVKSTFNLPLMTRFSVGLDWSKATSDEQQQLTAAFSDFSVATYASQFKVYDGEAFRVVDEKATPGGTIVETELTPKNGAPIPINYLMKLDDNGKMRVVDVFLDGAISELATRRSEFTSIVHRDGIAALVTTLGNKTKQLGPS